LEILNGRHLPRKIWPILALHVAHWQGITPVLLGAYPKQLRSGHAACAARKTNGTASQVAVVFHSRLDTARTLQNAQGEASLPSVEIHSHLKSTLYETDSDRFPTRHNLPVCLGRSTRRPKLRLGQYVV
jgi:hypothetical protein